MRHARKDYDRIQDPDNKIGEDEPVFLIRGQDISAPEVLRFWADENIRNGGDPVATKLTEEWADEMERWQLENHCKPADMPKEQESE